MIFVGLSGKQKETCIARYVQQHDIQRVFIFSHRAKTKSFFIFQDCKVDRPAKQSDWKKYQKYGNYERFLVDGIPVVQMEFEESIMYRTFYPLLGEIDDKTLIVINECMRTSNRSDLHYNCIQKYTNQTNNILVFEFFPFISDTKDFLILLDFATSQRYKGQSLNDVDLSQFDIRCQRNHFQLIEQTVSLPEDAEAQYEAQKDWLFNNIGNKNPDTIPRQLHLWTGRFKRPFICDEVQYVARNSRFKLKNVTTFQHVSAGVQYTLLDIPHARLEINDFLRKTNQSKLPYLSTGFSVDRMYINEFNTWRDRLEDFYATTSIYSENS